MAELIFSFVSASFFDSASYLVPFSALIQFLTCTGPVQVRCMMLDAWGWCTGITQRDGMEREVGGGSGWGTRVYPWRIHVDVWQIQYNIVK